MIIFTNGCFDLLHTGHLRLLQYCSDIAKQSDRISIKMGSEELASKVIVGLNSDDSVRSLKGDDRPIIKQEERRYLLSCLKFVDEVHIFNEGTPRELIEKINPEIIVKGGRRYKGENPMVGDIFKGKLKMSEAQQEEVRGFEVKPFEIIEEYSTTKILNEILSNRR